LAAQGFAQMTTMAMSIADTHWGGKLVSVLEGGYSDNPGGYPGVSTSYNGLASSVVAHVATLMDRPVPDTRSEQVLFPRTRSDTPFVHRGVLYVPRGDLRRIERLCVVNSAGALCADIPLSALHNGKYKLAALGLSAGAYWIQVGMGNCSRLVIPLHMP
jgi:hypothetical protein